MQFCPECKFMTYTKLNRKETPHILEKIIVKIVVGKE